MSWLALSSTRTPGDRVARGGRSGLGRPRSEADEARGGDGYEAAAGRCSIAATAGLALFRARVPDDHHRQDPEVRHARADDREAGAEGGEDGLASCRTAGLQARPCVMFLSPLGRG
jgi:hypothetical protein